jgi:hypothetical protein
VHDGIDGAVAKERIKAVAIARVAYNELGLEGPLDKLAVPAAQIIEDNSAIAALL